MTVGETLVCSFQILKPVENKKPNKFGFGSTTTVKHSTPTKAKVFWFVEFILEFNVAEIDLSFNYWYVPKTLGNSQNKTLKYIKCKYKK